MPIITKRWNDPREPTDGRRILIARYRPRGLPKADETWDQWLPQLGPSEKLLAAYHGKGRTPLPWSAYRTQYISEMRSQRELIEQLAAQVAAGEPITLLCSSSCVRENRCHRSLLRQLIETRMKNVGASST